MGETAFNALVVDDEALYARAVARELGRQGMTCELAHTAGDALRQVEAGAFDLVLLDNRLPDEEGLAIVPRLLARQPRPAVVVMTGRPAARASRRTVGKFSASEGKTKIALRS